jgi:hypothetical protein
MSDEIQNLLLQVKGEVELQRLNDLLKQEKEKLLDLIALQPQTQAGMGRSTAVIEAQAKSILDLNAQIVTLNKEVGRFSTGAALQASYILDDLVNSSGNWERHLASISNNIPGMAMSLKGMGTYGDKIAALAGPIGLVGTALIALAPVAHALWNTFTSDEPKEKLDGIAEAAKRIKTELDKLRDSQTSEQQTTQKGFEDLIAGHGKELQGSIAKAIGASGRGEQMNSAEIQATGDDAIDTAVTLAEMTASRAGRSLSAAEVEQVKAQARVAQQDARNAAQKRINEANFGAAGTLLGKLPTDRSARDTIRALAKGNPGSFAPGFLGDFNSMEPEALAQADAEAEAFDAQNRDYAAARDSKRRASQRAKREKAEADRRDRESKSQLAAAVREADAELRAIEHQQAAEQRKRDHDAKAAEVQQERNRRARPVQRAAAQLGTMAAADGISPTQATLEQAGQEMVRTMERGADANQALMAAYAGMILGMRQAQARLQGQVMQLNQMRQQNNAHMGGGDNSGAFSFVPPMWGGF